MERIITKGILQRVLLNFHEPPARRWLGVLRRGSKMINRKKVLPVVLVLSLLASVPVLTAGAEPAFMYPGNQPGQESSLQEAIEYSDAWASISVQSTGFYTVCQGDTLTGIACKYGLNVDELATINKLDCTDFIVEGQLLKVPGSVITHQVREGETLWSISERYRVSLKELAVTNSLSNENFVAVGRELVIPALARVDSYSQIARAPVPVVKLAWPVTGWISSPFGMRDGRPHEGIDLAANQGDPIKAARSGRVVYADPMGTYGLVVIIEHGDGMRTLYAHASVLLVKAGELVDEGQTVALVGSTGRSTGPHLHLEVRYHGQPLDPLLYLESMYA